MTRFILLAAFIFVPVGAIANTQKFAMGLALVLASEAPCGLSYRQDAITAMIERNVPADDIDFPGTLAFWTEDKAEDVAAMTGSAKTAHCAQVARVAKSNGLID